jgi:hypothetical protein
VVSYFASQLLSTTGLALQQSDVRLLFLSYLTSNPNANFGQFMDLISTVKSLNSTEFTQLMAIGTTADLDIKDLLYLAHLPKEIGNIANFLNTNQNSTLSIGYILNVVSVARKTGIKIIDILNAYNASSTAYLGQFYNFFDEGTITMVPADIGFTNCETFQYKKLSAHGNYKVCGVQLISFTILGSYTDQKGRKTVGMWQIKLNETQFFEAPASISMGLAKNRSADAIDFAADEVDKKFNKDFTPSNAALRQEVINFFLQETSKNMEAFGGRRTGNNHYNTQSIFLYRPSFVRTNCE